VNYTGSCSGTASIWSPPCYARRARRRFLGSHLGALRSHYRRAASAESNHADQPHRYGFAPIHPATQPARHGQQLPADHGQSEQFSSLQCARHADPGAARPVGHRSQLAKRAMPSAPRPSASSIKAAARDQTRISTGDTISARGNLTTSPDPSTATPVTPFHFSPSARTWRLSSGLWAPLQTHQLRPAQSELHQLRARSRTGAPPRAPSPVSDSTIIFRCARASTTGASAAAIAAISKIPSPMLTGAGPSRSLVLPLARSIPPPAHRRHRIRFRRFPPRASSNRFHSLRQLQHLFQDE